MPQPTLTRQARRFVAALDELGFNDDDPISGADTVDVIAGYIGLLNKLPALAELAEAVDKFLNHKGEMPTTADYAVLEAAFAKLEAK